MTQEVISEKHDVGLIYHGAISCCNGFSLSPGRGVLGKGSEWVSKCCFEGAMGEALQQEGRERGYRRDHSSHHMSWAAPHVQIPKSGVLPVKLWIAVEALLTF